MLRLTPVGPRKRGKRAESADLHLRYAYAAAVRGLRPVRAKIDVDGSTIACDSKLKITDVDAGDNAGTIGIDKSHRMTTGHRRLTVTLDDDAAIWSST